MQYNKNTLYITGISRSNSVDPITIMYNSFFIGIIIEEETNKIVDITSNTISNATTEFIKSILVGYNLVKDLDSMIQEIQHRFLGTAQKALIVALKDAHNKYIIELKRKGR
ncbi:DUF3870 domain-containing protein [Clostridium rectalis]|uniref:DUF3870 domain-containing protein n=1 Tax=Clostridium rectalis TaxID=2040295 RepID=UPI000F63542C|nr:DUF3870 domain-containing protein [Clostridium rectalis]